MTTLCKDVINELFDLTPANLLTIGLTSQFYNECATYYMETTVLAPKSFKDQMRYILDMKNISTGGVMNMVPALCKGRWLAAVRYVASKDAVANLGDGDGVGFNTAEIISESVKRDADNIVEWLINSKILRWSMVKRNYYHLIRSSSGTVLRILLNRFKENIAVDTVTVGKPKLNMFNAMIMRLVGEQDMIAIQTLKDFGYIDSIVHYVPNEHPQFIERAIIESNKAHNYPSYNLTGSSLHIYAHKWKKTSSFDKWFYETIVEPVKNEYSFHAITQQYLFSPDEASDHI